jgi:hypothetical protein
MESAYDQNQNQRKGSWLGTIGKIGLGAGVLGLGYLGYKKFGLPKWGWGRQRNLQPKSLVPTVKPKLLAPTSLNKTNKQLYPTKNLYT